KDTADFESLCHLYIKTEIPSLLEVIKQIKLRTRFSDLHKLQPFKDGRLRCNYNPVATDTGRLNSSATSVRGEILKPLVRFDKQGNLTLKYSKKFDTLGTNLQNQTKDVRDLMIPDTDDFEFWQFDLSGADAWTVGADLAALGKDRMLRHL